MIIKPFKVHSPDGKSFYEGEASPGGEASEHKRYTFAGDASEREAFDTWWANVTLPSNWPIMAPGQRYEFVWNAARAALATDAARPSDEPPEIVKWISDKFIQESESTDAAKGEAKPIQPVIALSAAQLVEALDFIAPDRATDPEQLDAEVAFGYGDGHSGKALYVWDAEYPEEGSFVLDGSPVARIAAPEVTADDARKQLERFLDAASGEGLVIDGIDAADLYIKLFPKEYERHLAAYEGDSAEKGTQ